MFTNFQNKAMGFGVGTLVSSTQKMFSEQSLMQGPTNIEKMSETNSNFHVTWCATGKV